MLVAQEAQNVMNIELALAKGSLDRVAMRDPATRYHPMTIAELQSKTPNFDWKTLRKNWSIGLVARPTAPR